MLVFIRLQTLVLFFLCFSAFCEFQCLFCKKTFVLTFSMGIFYFILVWRGVKSIKLKKHAFFYRPSRNLQYKIIIILILFFSVPINFQCKSDSHKSLFMQLVFSSIALLILSYLQFHCLNNYYRNILIHLGLEGVKIHTI